jgi:hypothetical protein
MPWPPPAPASRLCLTVWHRIDSDRPTCAPRGPQVAINTSPALKRRKVCRWTPDETDALVNLTYAVGASSGPSRGVLLRLQGHRGWARWVSWRRVLAGG